MHARQWLKVPDAVGGEILWVMWVYSHAYMSHLLGLQSYNEPINLMHVGASECVGYCSHVQHKTAFTIILRDWACVAFPTPGPHYHVIICGQAFAL